MNWKLSQKEKELLAAMDEMMKKNCPNVQIKEGCRFARWYEFEGIQDVKMFEPTDIAAKSQVFQGSVCGKDLTILMIIPYFD